MSFAQIKDLLEGMPTVSALWWFIENMPNDYPDYAVHSEVFFYLRERVRAEQS